jgi:hypothetical protein
MEVCQKNVLEKRSEKTIVAMALASIMVLAFQLSQSTPAYAGGNDHFGVKEVYPTAQGGNEWYVNMDDPRDDPSFKNLDKVKFSKNSDGSWRVSADQIRMEAWSPANEKWQNIEMTEYAKMVDGSHDLFQIYSRGGHHTDRDQCLGSAYKARLYGNGIAAWNKELTHPAYAGNRGEMQAAGALEGKWIGFKAVIYNFVENGKTYVRLESYVDDDVTGSNGNLVIKNNWKLASVVEDRGGWASNDSDFNSSCGRERDEILLGPGGTSSQNIAAFRSDDLTWDFKYLSVREIDPLSPTKQPVQEEPVQPVAYTPEDNNDSSNSGYNCDTSSCILIAGQHVPNNGDAITAISSVDLQLRKTTSRTSGTAIVALVKDGNVVDKDIIDVSSLRTTQFSTVTAQFNPSVDVAGSSFDIVVFFEGQDRVVALSDDDYISGNMFYGGEEEKSYDLVFGIHQSL